MDMARHYRQRGFTLLEIVLVMFVIGIAFGMVAISIGSGTRPYEIKSAAKSLYASASLASEEAILTNTQFGLRFDLDPDYAGPDEHFVYDWYQFDTVNMRWVKLENHDVLKSGKFPEHIRLQIEIEGQPLVVGAKEKQKSKLALEQKQEEDGKGEPEYPDIYFMSSGELSAFTVRISDKDLAEYDGEYRVEGEMVGRVKYILPGDAEDSGHKSNDDDEK
jgi:general secretion pathway protein H